ncbi:MAG: Fic family protein [Bacteroidota bacterium]
MYKPPYEISDGMRDQCEHIIRLIGQIEGYQLLQTDFKLRRSNQVKSLHSSLLIEGNSLTLDQVTAVIDGKPVIGPINDIIEVKNAIALYEKIADLDPYNEENLLKAHHILMEGLLPDAGKYRTSGVGVFDGHRAIHIGPPANRVPSLMAQLFDYLKNTPESAIIKSCVFHYEFEFIHPFADGNGRMGRFWQTAILSKKYPILAYAAIETVIHQRQQAYYDALRQSGQRGDSNLFIIYMLDAIEAALDFILKSTTMIPSDPQSRLAAFREYIDTMAFQRKDYLLYHKNIASATASRDLRQGTTAGQLKRIGTGRTTTYQFQ